MKKEKTDYDETLFFVPSSDEYIIEKDHLSN